MPNDASSPNRLKWPRQRDAVSFYGDPYSPSFEKNNIIRIKTPWICFYGSQMVGSIAVHKKCADAFKEWFAAVWKNAEQRQFVINQWGMSSFSGSFVVRPKRGGSTPSMHSFGCAMDWDAGRNGFHDHTPNFALAPMHDAIVNPFKDLGGTWGGDWPNATDGMHFQFANVT